MTQLEQRGEARSNSSLHVSGKFITLYFIKFFSDKDNNLFRCTQDDNTTS